MEPQPGEIWKTRSDRLVLIVVHPMMELGKLGFIWHDEIDGNLNFSPLQDQLAFKLDLTIVEWAQQIESLTS